MARKLKRKEEALALAHLESAGPGSSLGALLRQVILGGQDGLVNVLGVLLGVAAGTSDVRVVIIAGFAATFAESISMAAVAYTSARAQRDYYLGRLELERREIREMPEVEKEEVRYLYRKKGFRGKQLEEIVRIITAKERTWLDIMMREEHGLSESEKVNPRREAFVVGVASFIGSLIPLLPFLVLPLASAIAASLIVTLITLFLAGMVKARFTTGKPLRSAVEMAVVGMAAALAGYLIGAFVGAQV